VLGFGVEIALVVAMARSNTARWERDHRAARAAIRAREEAGLRVRAAGLVAQRVPHPHLTHLPHVHLPPRVVDRLAHTREVLHVPRLHLPRLTRHPARPDIPAPAPAPDIPAPAPAPDDASTPAPDDASTPAEEQPTS
jgi:hypothetical protein